MNILFEILVARDVALKGKDSLVNVAPIIYKDMIIRFTAGEFSRIKVSLGSIFDLKLNSDAFSLEQCSFI
jgi:hypothetical protein